MTANNLFKEFLSQYGMTIVYAILTAIAGFIGSQIKKIYEQKCNTDEKRKAAETVVKAIEQMYGDLKGDEKFNKAEKALVDMLNDKGILITELECEMLIESVVAEFNNAWEKNRAISEGADEDDLK